MRWHGAKAGAALVAAALMAAPAAALGQEDLLSGLDAVQSDGLGGVSAGVKGSAEGTTNGVFEAVRTVGEAKKEELGSGYEPFMEGLERAEWGLALGLSQLEAGLGQAGGALNNAQGLPQGPLASSVNPIPGFGPGF